MKERFAKVDAVAYPQLIDIWEKSVRATHDFLTEVDISHYKELIFNEYFDQVSLYAAFDRDRVIGFIGLDQKMIQMLFIHPEYRGKGVGKQLVEFAIEAFGVDRVDVNEQNAQAIGFYERLGFEIFERSEFDAAGKPYPILSMVLNTR